jgi:hypothetical protein
LIARSTRKPKHNVAFKITFDQWRSLGISTPYAGSGKNGQPSYQETLASLDDQARPTGEVRMVARSDPQLWSNPRVVDVPILLQE